MNYLTAEGCKFVFTTVAGNLNYFTGSQGQLESIKYRTPEDVPPEKQAEAITGAVSIALLAFETDGVKIGIKDKKVKVYPRMDTSYKAQYNQHCERSNDKVCQDDIYKLFVFHFIYLRPQSWCEEGARWTKALAKLHDLTIDGLEKLKMSYRDTAFDAHVNSYITKIERFVRENLEVEECIKVRALLEKRVRSIPCSPKVNETRAVDKKREGREGEKEEEEKVLECKGSEGAMGGAKATDSEARVSTGEGKEKEREKEAVNDGGKEGTPYNNISAEVTRRFWTIEKLERLVAKMEKLWEYKLSGKSEKYPEIFKSKIKKLIAKNEEHFAKYDAAFKGFNGDNA